MFDLQLSYEILNGSYYIGVRFLKRNVAYRHSGFGAVDIPRGLSAYRNHKNTTYNTAKLGLKRHTGSTSVVYLLNVCMCVYAPSAQLLACRANVQQSEVGRLIAHTDSLNTSLRTASLCYSLSVSQCFLGRGSGRTRVIVCLAVSTSDSLLCSLFVSVQSDNLLYLWVGIIYQLRYHTAHWLVVVAPEEGESSCLSHTYGSSRNVLTRT